VSEKQPEKHITLTEGQDHLPKPRLEKLVRRTLRKFEKLERRLASGEQLRPSEADG
jgi:hypothetical protein